MAKQNGPVYLTGTYNGICFYKMGGEFYTRRKSSLSGKRVKKDKAFTLTMVYAGIFGQASAIAAAVYRSLDPRMRKHALYRAMTGRASQLLKKGVDAEAVKAQLLAECMPITKKVHDAKQVTAGNVVSTAKQVVHVPAKRLRIASNKQRKRPLLHDRRGKLFVSTQGLLSRVDEDGAVVLCTRLKMHYHRTKEVLPLTDPVTCDDN